MGCGPMVMGPIVMVWCSWVTSRGFDFDFGS